MKPYSDDEHMLNSAHVINDIYVCIDITALPRFFGRLPISISLPYGK